MLKLALKVLIVSLHFQPLSSTPCLHSVTSALDHAHKPWPCSLNYRRSRTLCRICCWWNLTLLSGRVWGQLYSSDIVSENMWRLLWTFLWNIVEYYEIMLGNIIFETAVCYVRDEFYFHQKCHSCIRSEKVTGTFKCGSSTQYY